MTTDEIVDQVMYYLQERLEVDSISFMGMGKQRSLYINNSCLS